MFLWKDVVFGRRLSDDEVLSPDLPARMADGFATAMPVFRFLSFGIVGEINNHGIKIRVVKKIMPPDGTPYPLTLCVFDPEENKIFTGLFV